MSRMKNIQQLTNAGIPTDIAPYLFLQNNAWVFEAWDSVPGPGEDDFICTYTSREDAVKAVTAYLYGEPTTVDDWVVPLHRHPEIHLKGVQHALANAVNISQEAFEGIAERRRERILRYYSFHERGINRWQQALQYQFLSLVHRADPSILLRLRRDMQETYIVHLQ